MSAPSSSASHFRDIPYMGVIFVVAEAMKLGFTNGHPDWCNLGQGQPEVGEMEGAPPRISSIAMEASDHAYGPIGGTDAFRSCVADHYNRLFRQGKRSQYTKDNVSVASGGRLMLTRLFASLGELNVGYQIPDYTAYQDMLSGHSHRFTSVLLPAKEEHGFKIPAERLERIVETQGLGAFVLSNPCNPTGNVIRGKELQSYLDTARRHDCLLVLDEFYSHFIYGADGAPGAGAVSGAEFVEDVESDPVLLIDGLTKSFRYPGWRVGWVVGPSELIDTIGRAASAIDGGPSAPVQRAALEVLAPERADQETAAVRKVFAAKRQLMVDTLRDLGLRVCPDPEGTFYVWASVQDLEPPFNDAMAFFRQALERKVMTVPGVFFDVNPGGRRRGPSPYDQWMRFSFGPPMDNMRLGLDRLSRMLRGR